MKVSPDRFIAYTGDVDTISSTVATTGFHYVSVQASRQKEPVTKRFTGMAGPDTVSLLLNYRQGLSLSARMAIAKIRSFSLLEENWDSHGAAATSERAIKESIRIVQMLDRRDIPVYFAAPGPSGEVVVEVQSGDRSIEFHVNDDGSAEVCAFEGEACELEGTMTVPGVDRVLNWFLWENE